MPHFPKAFYKNSRSTWYVQLDGKQYNLNTYFADRPRLGPDAAEAAQERCVELKQALRSQRPAESVPSKAVVALLDKFLDWVKDHRAPRTYEWYQWRLQLFADFIGRELQVMQLKHYHIDEWLNSRPRWTNGTKHGMAQAVMAAIRWATKKGYCDKNPVAGYDKPPMGKRDVVISPDEYKRILSNVQTDEFRDLLTIAWETGCRPQEVLAVEARHVDLDNSRWVIPAEESKGRKWPRIVYLNDTALEITKRLMEKHPDGKLFRNSQGRPWTAYAVNCSFGRLRTKLGKRYCLYNFRHSWANRALAGGMDALTVAVLMGHRDPSTLARTYQHLNQNTAYLHEAFIYYARRRGLVFLREAYAERGIEWEPPGAVESRTRTRSSMHLLHEVGISEIQLNLSQSLNRYESLKVRYFERRFRRPDRRLYFTHKGKQYSLIPDAGFLVGRQSTPPAFVPFTFLEFDAGTMTLKQMKRKFDTYAHWMQSAEGRQYLIDLYAHHGAANPRPEFRVVVIASDKLNAEKHDRRLLDIVMATLDQPVELRHRLWITSVADLKAYADDERPLAHAIFLRGHDVDAWIDGFRSLDTLKPPKERTSSAQ